MKLSVFNRPIILTLIVAFGFGASAQDGEAVFKANCSACHKMGMRLVGPDLTGVTEKRSEDWIASFIRNSQKMIADGDADAVAIFEEFNKVPMTSFDLNDADMSALITYLGTFGASAGGDESAEEAEPVEVVPFEYTEDDVAHGMALFQGGESLAGGGPSCVACHNVTNDDVIPGGLMAKDLTNVFSRMGDAGLAGILGAPPFPSMTNAYNGDAALTEEEIHALMAFFANADEVAATQTKNNGHGLLFGGGVAGLIVILILIGIMWAGRMKRNVKEDILNRQIKSI